VEERVGERMLLSNFTGKNLLGITSAFYDSGDYSILITTVATNFGAAGERDRLGRIRRRLADGTIQHYGSI
jgi:hypothetical protein